jgi:hypothetical protein
MKRIAELYLRGDAFADEANQTIGKPALTDEVINNRRRVTSRLTDVGREQLAKVADYFAKNYGVEVKFKWNIHCGCNMCPCSPGFDVLVNCKGYRLQMRDENRANIWFKEDGKMDFREPEMKYRFSQVIEMAREQKEKVAA